MNRPTVDSDCIRTQLMIMEFFQYVSTNRPHACQEKQWRTTPTHAAAPYVPPPPPARPRAHSGSRTATVIFPIHKTRLLCRGSPGTENIPSPYGNDSASGSWLPSSSKPLNADPDLCFILPCRTCPHPSSTPSAQRADIIISSRTFCPRNRLFRAYAKLTSNR